MSTALKMRLAMALGSALLAAVPGAGILVPIAKTAIVVAPLVRKAAPFLGPAVDIPSAWRRRNWAPHGQGSCVHASMVHLLHWQGLHELGDWWEANCHSGETFAGLAERLDAADVRWAGTDNGDESFLDWALATRRGAAVTVYVGPFAGHMINLVHLDKVHAATLDNNKPGEIRWWTRAEFLESWRAGGAWAVTPVYSPPPSKPWM